MSIQNQTASRRTLLRGAALFPLCLGLGLSLEACQTAQTFSDVAQKVSVIADAFATFVPAITAVGGVSAKVVGTIQNAVADISAVAKSVAGATADEATSLVTKAENGVAAVAQLVPHLSLPKALSWIVTAAQDAITLMPLIKTAVGLLVPAAPSPQAVRLAEANLRAVAVTYGAR